AVGNQQRPEDRDQRYHRQPDQSPALEEAEAPEAPQPVAVSAGRRGHLGSGRGDAHPLPISWLDGIEAISSLVYGCDGEPITVSDAPASTISPLRNTMIRSAMNLAAARS